jgi:sialate O-acetylesterase
VAPYAIRGGLWYQAESNCGKGEDPRFYAEKMRALMRGWRKAWDNPKMPIYYVQLPQFDSSNWVRMREEQRMVMNDPHTGMVVLHDLFPFGIHPPNKLDVAKRLALWPLSKVYDKKIVCSGPQYSHIEIQDKQLVIHFKPTSSKLKMGLKADLHETLLLRKGELQGFEICDSQKSWFRAKAEIVGQTVVCSHEKVTHPIGVRYAWGKTMPSDFKWNLYNDAGLPASSFISDLKLAPFQLDGEP